MSAGLKFSQSFLAIYKTPVCLPSFLPRLVFVLNVCSPFAALTRRWSDVKRNYDAVGQAHREWKKTKQTMQNVTRFADDVSKLVGSISERIDR